MSYIVNQKIKGNIYQYEVTSYWDKEKKQSRQKRKYLGRKNPKQKKKLSIKNEIINKKYGNVFLLRTIAQKLGLTSILKKYFCCIKVWLANYPCDNG